MAYVEPELSSILGIVDAHLKYENLNGAPRGHQKYHPSAVGGCLRQMQYQRYAERGYLNQQDKPFESKLLRIFGQGHTMHERWVNYAQKMGILRGYWNCKNILCQAFKEDGSTCVQAIRDVTLNKKKPRIYGMENQIGVFKPQICKCGCKQFSYEEVDVISKELNLSGHCDMIFDFSNVDKTKYEGIKKTFKFEDLPSKPIVVDMKSINDFGYSNVLKKGPSLKYQVQLTIYANILPVQYGILIYQNKNSAQTAIYKIEKNTETIYQKISQQMKSMQKMVDKKMLPPPRPDSKDSYDCQNCGFKKVCHQSKVWDNANLEEKRKEFYGKLI